MRVLKRQGGLASPCQGGRYKPPTRVPASDAQLSDLSRITARGEPRSSVHGITPPCERAPSELLSALPGLIQLVVTTMGIVIGVPAVVPVIGVAVRSPVVTVAAADSS